MWGKIVGFFLKLWNWRNKDLVQFLERSHWNNRSVVYIHFWVGKGCELTTGDGEKLAKWGNVVLQLRPGTFLPSWKQRVVDIHHLAVSLSHVVWDSPRDNDAGMYCIGSVQRNGDLSLASCSLIQGNGRWSYNGEEKIALRLIPLWIRGCLPERK